MALARPMGTLTLHYCADVVVEDLHQLLRPSVHVHGCAELLSHRRETCSKGQVVSLAAWKKQPEQERRAHWGALRPPLGPVKASSRPLWLTQCWLCSLHHLVII